MVDKNTFNVLFLIKRTKLLKNGEAPIYMRITVKGERTETTANSSIDPKLWDQSKGQVKKGASDASSRNNYLTNLRLKIQSHKRDLTDKGIPLTGRGKDYFLARFRFCESLLV